MAMVIFFTAEVVPWAIATPPAQACAEHFFSVYNCIFQLFSIFEFSKDRGFVDHFLDGFILFSTGQALNNGPACKTAYHNSNQINPIA